MMQGPVMLVKGFTQRLHSSPEIFQVMSIYPLHNLFANETGT
jgi:hypothetical protein